MKIVYEPANDNEGKWYPKVPGEGLSYYGGCLFPDHRRKTEEEAQLLCNAMNLAFAQGSADRAKRIRKEIGAL